MVSTATHKGSKVMVNPRIGGGTAVVDVEDGRDREYVGDLFAHWPVKHLKVLVEGLNDLLALSGADRKVRARREDAWLAWSSKHPGGSYSAYLRSRKAR